MKLSDKLGLWALCMLVVAIVTFSAGFSAQSDRWCATGIAFLLFAGAFLSEALVYKDKGE